MVTKLVLKKAVRKGGQPATKLAKRLSEEVIQYLTELSDASGKIDGSKSLQSTSEAKVNGKAGPDRIKFCNNLWKKRTEMTRKMFYPATIPSSSYSIHPIVIMSAFEPPTQPVCPKLLLSNFQRS